MLLIKYTITLGCIGVWQSILVDLILLVRLVAVYPPRSVGLIRFTLLITIPVSLKIARVINILLFTVAVAEAAKGPNPTIMTTIVFITKPYLRIEWGTQMTDNTLVLIDIDSRNCLDCSFLDTCLSHSFGRYVIWETNGL